MRRRLESWLPAAVLIGFVAVVVVVNLLLSAAQRDGVEALEASANAEVEAIARSQDQRIASSISAAGTFVNDPDDPFDLEVGSEHDLAKLNEIVELGFDLRSGFYLVDSAGVITQGVQLLGDRIGTTFDWPGYAELVASPTFQRGIGYLPVSDALTTAEPAFATLLAVVDQQTGAVRGAFVFENVVAADTTLNQEISQLARGETGQYLFFDSRGTVLATNALSLIGQRVDDEVLIDEAPGVDRRDGRLVVVADVPTPGWRVAFRQDVDEFESALSRPLENVGRVLIVVLLAAGFLMTALLYNRLKAARSEQERLQRLSDSQQELISIVSHELRTPVAGVLGFLETSLDHWDRMDDEERRAAVGRAAANARRLQALTRDVLDAQRVEAGGLVHVFDRLDLASEVEQAVDAARDLDVERAFEVTTTGQPLWVQADGDRLQQVLANLLENARKNSPAAEPIEVEVGSHDGLAEVRVTDHGAGITEDALERIFDKFVRSPGDTVSGTGLGLYISRQILEAHHGRIWAESEPGQGATFRFVLPLADGTDKVVKT